MAKERKPRKTKTKMSMANPGLPKEIEERPRASRTIPPPPPPTEPVPLNQPLNEDEQTFVDQYLIDRNYTQAYKRCFPDSNWRQCRQQGREMRARPHVDAEITASLRSQSIRTQLTADKVVEELARIAFSDIFEMYDYSTRSIRTPLELPYNIRKCVAALEIQRQRQTTAQRRSRRVQIVDQIVKFKLWSKTDALRLLCEHFGLRTAISPIEALLRMLPSPMASELRKILAQQAGQLPPEDDPKPSGNVLENKENDDD